MPFIEILPEKLDFLELFGFEVLFDGGNYLIVKCSDENEHYVEKKEPWLWFDSDEVWESAIQLGGKGIFITPRDKR